MKTRQKEFNYPQGDTNNLTSYEGTGGIGSAASCAARSSRSIAATSPKLPFSDDVTPESRLLMRRNVRERVQELAPFLTFDPDPYIVVGEDGRLFWMMDGFTTSDVVSRTRGTTVLGKRPHQLHAQQREGRRSTPTPGTTTFYVFDAQDPIIAAYRAVFPSLFKDAAAMPADAAQARALSGAAAEGAGRGLRPVSHDRSRRVLQPRGSVDRRERSAATRASSASRSWSRTSC